VPPESRTPSGYEELPDPVSLTVVNPPGDLDYQS
jgi:hypothetical protein